MKDIFVIGVDPAPSKKSTVCYPEGGEIKFEKLTPHKLKDFLDKRGEPNILICWDSPLTGVVEPESKGSFYTRDIEKFFQKQTFVKDKESGVSVLGFAGCTHWTVSRYVLGLPMFSVYDKEIIPFRLITSVEELELKGKMITEVHPAIAIHHWYGKSIKGYKTKSKQAKDIFEVIKKQWKLTLGVEPKNSDELDALVAFVLGTLWLKQRDVKIYGNKKGSFLLPTNDWKL